MGKPVRRIFAFGGFQLEPEERRLRQDGKFVQLPPKIFDLLVLLVENRGRLLEKEHLLKVLWPDVVVEESNLTVNVSALRRVLSPDGGDTPYIETVPKRGYRFIADVNEVVEPSEPPVAEPIVSPTSSRRKLMLWLGAAAVVEILLVGGSFFWKAWTKPPGLGSLRSIAVLPFITLDGGDSQAHLGLGMADALITRLASVGRLMVRPTSAVLKYTDLQRDPKVAGQELGVDALLEGRIQVADKRIRVTVQLLRVRDGNALWSEKFDDYFTNIFAVQDTISEKVAEALELKLSAPELRLLTKRYTESTEAYQLYLQGRYLESKRLRDATDRSIEYYQQALAKDPEYPLPYAGLAVSYMTLTGYVSLGAGKAGAEMREKARQSALKALSLDSNLAEAHVAFGQILMRGDWDWQGAEHAFDRAISIDKNLAAAHSSKAILATALARHSQALSEMELACRLDPTSAGIRSDMAWVLYCARRYDDALKFSRKAIEMDPGSPPAHREFGKQYLMKGMNAEAVEEAQKALSLAGSGMSGELADLGEAYARAGNRSEAEKILRQIERGSSGDALHYYGKAVLYTSLGRTDEAFQSLEKACDFRQWRVIWMNVDPELDALRSDPRFQSLLTRLRL